MANSFNDKPMRIDTTMGSSWRSQPGVLGISPLLPILVYWFDPITAGDTFQITDTKRSIVVLEGRCENAAQSQFFPISGHLWADFIVTISSGTLEIYYK